VITLLQPYRETLVLPEDASTVQQRLANATSNQPFDQPHEPVLVFNGWVKEDRFRITLRARRANHFAALVVGQLEASSNGCILLLRYSLFPNTRWMLNFWTILILLGAVIGWVQFHRFIVPAVAAASLAVIYFVAWSNFKIQQRLTREAVLRVAS